MLHINDVYANIAAYGCIYCNIETITVIMNVILAVFDMRYFTRYVLLKKSKLINVGGLLVEPW